MNTVVETTTSVINPEAAPVAETPATPAAPAKSKMGQNIVTAAVVTGGIAGGILIGREASKYSISRQRFYELLSEIQQVIYGESCKSVPDAYKIALAHEAAELCSTASKEIPMRNTRASDSEFHQNAAIICDNLLNGATIRNGTFTGLQSLKEGLRAMADYHRRAQLRIDAQILDDPALPQKVLLNIKRMFRQPLTARKIRKEYGADNSAEPESEDDTTV